MPEIINLNKVRKARKQQADKKQAAANRQAFGRTKAQKLSDSQTQDQSRKTLEGHELTQDQASSDSED